MLSWLIAQLPSFSAARRSWLHTKSLQLADPEFYPPRPIDILIGSDNFGSIIQQGFLKSKLNEPIAQQTIFGWTLSGPTSMDKVSGPAVECHCTLDHDLQESLARFWTQEELPSRKPPILSPDEAECEQHFATTRE